MARFRVVLDACVLAPYQLADLLLRLADADLFEPLWSEEILAEVERTIVKLGVPTEKAQRRVRQMRIAFPNADVTDYQDLIDVMTTDPKEPCPGDDDIVYAKFMPNVEHPMRAFAGAPVENAKILTLVRCEDGWWRAWGLSPNYFPSAREVRRA